jgi:hypothetical protein
MWHATCVQGNQSDFRLLVVGSQIPIPFFGHNLHFKYSNGSCKPILNIHISRTFQWYKELFNPMNFDPYSCPLKIWESIRTPTPKVGAHFVVCAFIPHIFLHSHEHEMWLLGFTLVRTFASLCLGHEPKARVVTHYIVPEIQIEA